MEWYCGWWEIEYRAVLNGIVAGGILYIQRYGMLLCLEGDSIYSDMEWYCVWRELYIQRYGILLWLEGDCI